MRKILGVFLLSVLMLASVAVKGDNAIDSKVEQLLSQMTLEEKVGQMAQVTLNVVGVGKSRFTSDEPFALDNNKLRKAVLEYHVGSVINTSNNLARTPEVWFNIVSGIQDVAIKESRLKIPVIYGIDAIHGVTYTAGPTMFPQQITLAATFNPRYAKKMGEVTAYETRASSIPWNFSPVLDLGADPRFARQFEGFGEDPYLCSVMGAELIKGYQGEDANVSNPERVAACAKHYLGYSVPISGKDRTPAYIPDHVLREYHLPSFKAAVDAGVKTFMANSGIINGESVHASHYLLSTVLRDELGFKGVMVSDWADIENLCYRDRIAPTIKDAVKLAINAGVDMSMIAYQYEPFCKSLVELVKSGEVSESRINESVRRILKLKYELNLFEKPTTNYKDYPKFASSEYMQASYDAAAEAITLLKNEKNILPLSKGKKILVVGPTANTMRPLNGGWSYSWQGEKTDAFTAQYNTIYKAVAKEFGNDKVRYVAGVEFETAIEYYKEKKVAFEKVLGAARSSDIILLCLGENSYTETPGNLNDLYISDLQTELAREVAKANKPIVLVLAEGRPRVISKIEPLCNAVVQTYLPSNFGGDALAQILSGKINPSGKLPYTYPRYPNALGVYYHKPSEKSKTMDGAYNYSGDFSPQYSFGFGLSYTTFTYSGLKLSQKEISKDGGEVQVSVTVANQGKQAGKETVMLYTSDLYASITPDVKRLRRFEKIDLKAGESKTVNFTIGARDLAFVNPQSKWITEPGDFTVQIGGLVDTIKCK